MLIRLWAHGGNWSDIEEVVLVEKENGLVSQQAFAHAMHQKVFPQASLSVQFFE